MWVNPQFSADMFNLLKKFLMEKFILVHWFVQVNHSFLQGWNPPPPFLREPPLSGYPPHSEVNLKVTPPPPISESQIGACKLYETL